MLVPSHHGRLLQLGSYGPRRYPSAHHNMQFMAFRNPSSHRIYYVQTQDPDGQIIDWEVVSNANGYALKLTVYSLGAHFPAGLVLVDDTLIATAQIDFYQVVARKYKAWAVNQKWARRPASAMDHIATFAVAPDLRNVTMNNDITPYIQGWSGQDTGCWITFWRKYWQYGVDGAVPDYRLGGSAAESRASLDGMGSQRCAPFAYTNALLWDSNIVYTPNPAATLAADMNEIWDNNPDARYDPGHIIRDDAGQLASLSGDRPHMKYICQSSTHWQNTFLNACRTMAADGWKGIYYDMAAFAEPKLCYEPSHGHDLADPLVWQNGIRRLLTMLKADNATKRLLVITEGSAEVYMDLVDAYLTYAETGSADSTTPLNGAVPLFQEVYGEIARLTGWQVLPVSTPPKTNADLTPAILRHAITQSVNFGSYLYASPYFNGWSVAADIQKTLATDVSYRGLYDLLRQPRARQVYESGGGAVNWISQGGAPIAAAEYDTEVRTTAVRFAVSNRDGGAYYELPIGESARSHLSWDMRLTGSYYMRANVTGADGSAYLLQYDEHPRHYRAAANGIAHIGLGADTIDGKWRSFHRDLGSDLSQAFGTTLARVDNVRIYGAGLADNIALSDAPMTYEDGAGVANWAANGAGLSAASVADAETGSNVVSFTGIVNRDGGQYFSLPVSDNRRFEIAWDFKTTMPYYIVITVAADDGFWYDLLYDQHAHDFRQTVSKTIKIGLGVESTDGYWRTFRRNLAADLYHGSGTNIVQVISLRVYATAAVDNILMWGNGMRTLGSAAPLFKGRMPG